MPDVPHVTPSDRNERVNGNDTLTVGKSLTITVDERATVDVGKRIRIEAADELELVVGGARLLMKKDGSILLSGANIQISSRGTIEVKATRDLRMKGSKISDN